MKLAIPRVASSLIFSILSLLFASLGSIPSEASKCNQVLSAAARQLQTLSVRTQLRQEYTDFLTGLSERNRQFLLNHSGIGHPSPRIQEITQSDAFRRFCREKGYRWSRTPASERNQILNEFLDHFFSQFSGNRLAELRDASLRSSLQASGASVEPRISARENLERISRENVRRLLQGRTYSHQPGMTRAEGVVRQLRFRFRHNTNSGFLEGNPTSPLLSAHRLMDIGIVGRNTTSFNRLFLQTADQVFFFAEMSHPDRHVAHPTTSDYGQNRIHLEGDYAREHGLISIFVMHPDELMDAARTLMPAEARPIVEQFHGDPGNPHGPFIDWNEIPPSEHPRWQRIRDQLHRFHFTVSDLEQMIRTQLLLSLHQIRSSGSRADQRRYLRAMDILQGSHFHTEADFQRLLLDLVYRPLGLAYYDSALRREGPIFELRIPVAVEPHAMRVE